MPSASAITSANEFDLDLFSSPGVEGGIDLAKSVEWLVKAVAQEHTGAQCTYAMFHLDGKKGIPRNPTKAYHLYTMAAKKANALAIFNMGQMHQRGDGVEQSTQHALDLYVIAAKKKYPRACFVLGCFFAEGKVVKQDFKKAHELWTTAAQAGHQEAQQQLEEAQQQLEQLLSVDEAEQSGEQAEVPMHRVASLARLAGWSLGPVQARTAR